MIKADLVRCVCTNSLMPANSRLSELRDAKVNCMSREKCSDFMNRTKGGKNAKCKTEHIFNENKKVIYSNVAGSVATGSICGP